MKNFNAWTIIISSFFTLFPSVGFAISRVTFGQKGFLLHVQDHTSSMKWKDRFISFADLKKMQQDSIQARDREQNHESVWIGVKLHVLLEKQGVPIELIKRLSVSSSDGYMSVLSDDLLKGLELALCALRVEGKNKFPEEFGYMRVVFPDLHAMYWVNAPNKIVVTLGEEKKEGNTYELYFTYSAKFKKLLKEGVSTSRIEVADLFSTFHLPRDHFHVLARDGLFREYSVNRIIRHMILEKEKEETWKIDGVNVPTGLKTRQVFFITSGNVGTFLKSLSQEEKDLWEKKVWKGAGFPEGFQSRCSVTLVMEDGEHVTPKVLDGFQKGEMSLFHLLEEEHRRHRTLDHIKLEW